MSERETNEDARQSFVRITNREVYDALIHLEKTVDSMDGRLNQILGENVELRTRVRSLELKTYTVLAGMSTALIGGVVLLLRGAFGG